MHLYMMYQHWDTPMYCIRVCIELDMVYQPCDAPAYVPYRRLGIDSNSGESISNVVDRGENLFPGPGNVDGHHIYNTLQEGKHV